MGLFVYVPDGYLGAFAELLRDYDKILEFADKLDDDVKDEP